MIDLWLPPKPAIIRPADQKRLRLADRARYEASFMPGMLPVGVVASKAPPSISYVGFVHDDNQLTTYTFNNVPIGDPHPTRRIIAVIHFGDSTAVRTLTGCTIDGVSVLPSHAGIGASGPTGGTTHIVSMLKATGTTANFVVTINAAAASMDCNLHIFRALNETSSSPSGSMTDNTVSSNTLAGTLNVVNNGWVLAAGAFFGATPTPTDINWTGVTESFDESRGNSVVPISGGIQQNLTANAAYAVSMQPTPLPSVGQTGTLVAVGWG